MSDALKNKFSSFEATPPEAAWERIASALDQTPASFADKLYRYQQEPPQNTWEKILAALNRNKDQKAFTHPAKVRTLFRVAAAAAILIAVYFTWPLVSRNNSQTQKTTITFRPFPEKQQEITESSADQENNLQPQTHTGEKTPAVKNLENTVRAKTSGRKQNASRKDMEYVALNDVITKPTPQQDLIDINVPSDKYMVYLDQNGNAVRLPKKLYDAFECATREVVCQLKIRDLQQKFASSAISSDFTGVLEILRNLQENP